MPMTNGNNYVALIVRTLSVGFHSISTRYSGDGNFNGSQSSTLSFEVKQATTTNTISANVNPSVYGQTVTFYGAAWPVAPATTAAGLPTGSVTFFVETSSAARCRSAATPTTPPEPPATCPWAPTRCARSTAATAVSRVAIRRSTLSFQVAKASSTNTVSATRPR